MIGLHAGMRVWLAAGLTEMRKGFDGLATLAQSSLTQDPFLGHVPVFWRTSAINACLRDSTNGVSLLCRNRQG